jgi:hypothetical protein
VQQTAYMRTHVGERPGQGAAAVAWPIGAGARQVGKIYVLGEAFGQLFMNLCDCS